MTRTVAEICANIERLLPKWRAWFPSERSEVEIPRDDLLALVEAAKQREWQPMKSAPRDGNEVLLIVERRAGASGRMLVGHYMPGGHCIEDHPPIAEGWYFWNGCMFDKASKPLAWMPLPQYIARAESTNVPTEGGAK